MDSTTPTRQLAAIMFADMVGYTALMQEDEARAREARDRHRALLDSVVAAHNGQILQHYGDGTLSIFTSAVEAVECAIEVQMAPGAEATIPNGCVALLPCHPERTEADPTTTLS